MEKQPQQGAGEVQAAQVPGHRHFGRAHVIQSLIGGAYIFVVFLMMYALESGMAVASLGASTFIAFSFPHTQSSRPRFLIGGYCVGAAAGLVCYWLIAWVDSTGILPFSSYVTGCALAVFLAMLLMTSLNFEHPPSAALAIAVATAEQPILVGAVAIACVTLLCGVRHVLRRYLKNL